MPEYFQKCALLRRVIAFYNGVRRHSVELAVRPQSQCDMNAWSGGRCGQMLTGSLALVVVPHCAVSSRVALTAWMQVAPGRVSRAVPLSPSTALCLFPTVPTSHFIDFRGPSHRLPWRIPVASVVHPIDFRVESQWLPWFHLVECHGSRAGYMRVCESGIVRPVACGKC